MVINLVLFVWVASKFEYKALEKKPVSMPKAPGRGVVPRWVRPQIVSGGPVRFVQYPQYPLHICAPPPLSCLWTSVELQGCTCCAMLPQLPSASKT